MPLPVDILEFLNENALRAFPFKAPCSRTSVDGVFTIPNDLIADLLCSVDSDISKAFFVSKVTTSDISVGVEISVVGSAEIVGVFTFQPTAAVNTVVLLSASATFNNAQGKLIVGNPSSALALPMGVFLFTETTAALEDRCFVPSVAGVSQIILKDAAGKQVAYTGSVVLQAGFNLRFQGISGTSARLHAGEGLGLNIACDEATQPITTINGISPDSHGNFIFDASGCAALTAIPYGIKLLNDCTKPCMGCNEIATLLTRVMTVESNLLTLRNTYQTLLNEYQALQQALTCTC